MKRKKWSELEEQTLLTKYSELLSSGSLAKLKTREKKFRPIADHVNSVHHLHDPAAFPFRWSWRDVSIKVQNMRHQYLGVKQKIRVSKDEFNWPDGENHWENFLKYKEVFGDVELESRGRRVSDADVFGDCADLGFGIDCEDFEEDEEEEDEEDAGGGVEAGEEAMVGSDGEFVGDRGKKLKKGFGVNRKLGLMGAQVLELRDVAMRREERRRERDFNIEKEEEEKEEDRKELDSINEIRQTLREEELADREIELEERHAIWGRRESEKRLRIEHELGRERRKRMRMEEKREEEEMEWREQMLGLQIEHEKQMMQMHADACQNQMQILGVMARLVCQFFGSGGDGLGAGMGALPPQVLHHPGGLSDDVKPNANSPSEFL